MEPAVLPFKLSLFVSSALGGAPIARAPVYAEILVNAEAPGEAPADPDGRLRDAAETALRHDDPANVADADLRERLDMAVRLAIAQALGPNADTVLRANGGDPVDFINAVIAQARLAMGGAELRAIAARPLARALVRAVRDEGARRGLATTPAPTTPPALWAYPLGVLATDHVGYLSYDLSRLPEEVRLALAHAIAMRRIDPTTKLDVSATVYLLGSPDLAFDALAQGRFTADGIVARLELGEDMVPEAALKLALPSMQDPSLADWRLSPGSFAASPAGLIGQDGCESILPADVSLQEFHFYQVVRLTDVAPPQAPTVAGQVQLGVIHDYRLTWRALGHSLGQILYSLPLAPGESVNLAVIDWTRRDEAQRKERTTVDEQLVHNEHRDRIISETVDASVREYQHGSSFMGGVAGVSGGTFGPISAGIAGSLGGSTSSSSGQRGVAAGTVQRVSDNISQVSAASRELQSTVVVQTNQSEHEAIETRSIANYNHSHALTILYYEVLRHFRVVTELARRRPAVLVKMKTDWFAGADAAKVVHDHRGALAAALLDPAVAAGFDAIDRIEARRRMALALGAPPPPPPPGALAPGDREFIYFTFEMHTGGMYSMDMDDHGHRTELLASLAGAMVNLVNPAGDPILNQRGSFRQADATNTFTAVLPAGQAPVRWSAITGVAFWINPQGGDEEKISFVSIKVSGVDTGGGVEVLVDQSYAGGHYIVTDEGANMLLPSRRPPPPAPPPRPAGEIQDEIDRDRLIEHLKAHPLYYARAIHLAGNAIERAAELNAIKLAGGASVLEKLENRPIEIVGDYLAYPCTDGAWDEAIAESLEDPRDAPELSDERLVTLPTRGVFAEAKLGHCNASEIIDNTRFWDWQSSPIPRMAPEIAPVTPVTPQPQTPDLTPTPFPSSIVNIVNPPAAPDPTGMSSAMGVLGSSGLFRDMSGRAEVASILQNLADNAAKVAGGKGGGGGSGSGARGTGAATGGGIGGPRAAPNQPSAVNRDLHDLQKVLGQAQADGLMTPEAAQAAYTQATQDAVGGPMVAFAIGEGEPDVGSPLDPTPVHADELGEILLTYEHDKFAIFVPQRVLFSFQDEMQDVKVHLLFTAGEPALHDLLVHGVRGASNQSDWVTIVIPGKKGQSITISDAQIIACLRRADIKGSPTALRLSAHSRGSNGMMASVIGGLIKKLSMIERVVFLDDAVDHVESGPDKGAVEANRVKLLKARGIAASKQIAYEVNVHSVNTVTQVSDRVPQATYIDLPPNCMGAVGLARLIEDGAKINPAVATDLAAKPALKTLVNNLALPARGSFTSKGAAGHTSLTSFCQAHAADVQAIFSAASDADKGALRFVHDHNLSGYGRAFDWTIACHHFFVAEIAHELVD